MSEADAITKLTCRNAYLSSVIEQFVRLQARIAGKSEWDTEQEVNAKMKFVDDQFEKIWREESAKGDPT